ncbi:MAG: hypothetical protein K6E63_11155 [Lachnospiraceae bacterium]|nr:hypothetical protein [Lachnospiraceae bacterium]
MKIQKKKPTQINLMIRCIVAMYLIYLAHGLISELNTSENPRLMVGFAIFFTFVGVLIIAFTVKAFINKEYTDMNAIEADEEPSEGNGNKTPTEGTVIDELITDDAVIDERKDVKDETQDETGE